ncbi:unnamed protein product, partial [Ectocarpus sp. 13 AM-2016]
KVAQSPPPPLAPVLVYAKTRGGASAHRQNTPFMLWSVAVTAEQPVPHASVVSTHEISKKPSHKWNGTQKKGRKSSCLVMVEKSRANTSDNTPTTTVEREKTRGRKIH